MSNADYENKNTPCGYFIFRTIFYAPNDIMQFGVGIVAGKMYYRCKASITWGNWREVATR